MSKCLTITPLGAVLNTIYQIMKKYNKQYCYPSRETIQRYIKDFYGLSVSIRTISRMITVINNMGLLKVDHRNPKVMKGKVTFLSNMYTATKETYKTIHSTICKFLTPKQFLCGTKPSHYHSSNKRSDPHLPEIPPGGGEKILKGYFSPPWTHTQETEPPNWDQGKDKIAELNRFIKEIIRKK